MQTLSYFPNYKKEKTYKGKETYKSWLCLI